MRVEDIYVSFVGRFGRASTIFRPIGEATLRDGVLPAQPETGPLNPFGLQAVLAAAPIVNPESLVHHLKSREDKESGIRISKGRKSNLFDRKRRPRSWPDQVELRQPSEGALRVRLFQKRIRVRTPPELGP